jgi:hypothetical protein
MSIPGGPVEERIIGFDAREYWLSFEQSWSEHRKQGFLYRLDVLKPLSADRRVWPTIFASEGRPEPPQRFGFQGTWAHLAQLTEAVARAFRENPMRAWRTIAVTLILGDYCREDDVPWSSRLPPASPVSRGENWEFLGYDVTDQWLLSALSNCGFREGLDDIPRLRSEWSGRLNKFHLFSDLTDAILFKRYSDERLKADHAPCFAIGLWIVK